MLDDKNVLKQRDPADAIGVAAAQPLQAQFAADIDNPDHDGRPITKVVVAGMGGSALAASLLQAWLQSELAVPFEVVRNYGLPQYVDKNTLVIASSYSGNTEETLSALDQATAKQAQTAIISAGGKLITQARQDDMAHVVLPGDMQPRMAVIYNLRALTSLLVHFKIVSSDRFAEIAEASDWLEGQTKTWLPEVSTDKNYAKQLALLSVGKTPVFHGGGLTSSLAYKWKISWNENAKNVAFYSQYPEANHNEFIGWTSHPVEKPFAIIDLVSHLEHPQILKRFMVSDRLLSGQRPKSTVVNLAGDSVIKQLLWGSILSDFTSIYVAILNGVDPTPVPLIEKLKLELA